MTPASLLSTPPTISLARIPPRRILERVAVLRSATQASSLTPLLELYELCYFRVRDIHRFELLDVPGPHPSPTNGL